tara:strand:+ start:326 stop:532 length:207 start_codon:yes stop_codon:yes gene_type:complete
MKNEKIIVVRMKEMPPPEAVGLICELLLLGLSTKNFEKKGIISFNIDNDEINANINKKNELIKDIIFY